VIDVLIKSDCFSKFLYKRSKMAYSCEEDIIRRKMTGEADVLLASSHGVVAVLASGEASPAMAAALSGGNPKVEMARPRERYVTRA
jgi:hypothetical protein